MQRRVWPKEAEQENESPLTELDTGNRSGVGWGPRPRQAQKNTRRLVQGGNQDIMDPWPMFKVSVTYKGCVS